MGGFLRHRLISHRHGQASWTNQKPAFFVRLRLVPQVCGTLLFTSFAFGFYSLVNLGDSLFG